MRKFILFDLDGTLTDPAEGITKSVAYALSAYGIEVSDRSTLNCFIGPPLAESFSVYFGFSETDAKAAVDKYREYFSVTGLFENEVYDGIPEMLTALRNAGHVLAVATSKPTVFSDRILERFDLMKHFDYTLGSELDGRRVNKAEVIAEVMAHLGATPEDTLMIGDRKHDIIGAHKNNISAIGVLYGYGDRAEHEAYGADFILPTVADLTTFLMEE